MFYQRGRLPLCGSRFAPDSPRWLRMQPQRVQIALDGTRWRHRHQMDPDGPTAPNNFGWPQMAPYGPDGEVILPARAVALVRYHVLWTE